MKKLLCLATTLIVLLTACTAYANPTREWCNILDEILKENKGVFIGDIYIDVKNEDSIKEYFFADGFDLDDKKMRVLVGRDENEDENILLNIVIDDTDLYINPKKIIEEQGDTNSIGALMGDADYIYIDLKNVLTQDELDELWSRKQNGFWDGLYNEFKNGIKKEKNVEKKEDEYVLTLNNENLLNILERLFAYIQDNIEELTPIINRTFSIELTDEDIIVALSEILESLKDAPKFALEISLEKTSPDKTENYTDIMEDYTIIVELTIEDVLFFDSYSGISCREPNIKIPENYVDINSLLPPELIEDIDVNSPDYSFSLDVPDDLDSFFSGGF